MSLSCFRLIFLTFVALFFILIVLNGDKVACVPLTTASENQDKNDTVTDSVDVDRPAFHSERKNGSHGLANANPEIKKGLMDSTMDVVREGDIFVQYDRNVALHRWPSASLAYVITPALAYRTHDIRKAMKMISSKTCLSFHRRRNEADYLEFQPAFGCASFVGFLGGMQPIHVGPKCAVGNIAHELLHALGFNHEHSRLDRDKYIKIMYRNIIRGKEGNFKTTAANMLDLPYDLGSILHYGSLYFSSNGGNTIVPKYKSMELGQRTHLSKLDVKRIQKLYNCAPRTWRRWW